MQRSLICLFIAGSILLPSWLQAQQEYQEWLKSQQSEFQNFRDERDKHFMEFLEKEWEDFQLSKGIVRDAAPKPDTIPKTTPAPVAESDEKPEEQTVVEPPPLPEPEPEPPGVIETKPSPVKISNAKQARVDFFGRKVVVEYDPEMVVRLQTPINSDAISAFWSQIARSDYDPVHQQLREIRTSYGLNDWGYIQLLYRTGRAIQQNEPNTAKLFTWFMLLKSGYLTKVGFNADVVYLMFPSQNSVYDVSFLSVDESRFYIIPLDGDRMQLTAITSYEDDYPEATRQVDFRLRAMPQFGGTAEKKTVTFEYLGNTYSLNYRINRHAIDFFALYPQIELPVYPTAGLTGESAHELLKQLGDIVAGKPETRAVNILLRFVQTGFQYKTDDQQFGHENYLFPEETLFYPASDCEDRSALFAYLVKSLLNLDVVLLDYPGHVATAVKMQSLTDRDTIQHNGSAYVVCDPTYIYAEYGMTMPSVKDQEYSVIEL